QIGPNTGIGVERLAPATSSELTIVSSIGDAPGSVGGINKFGSGRLILQGDGSYSGPVDVREGVLRVQNDTALGQASSGTATSSGVGGSVTVTRTGNVYTIVFGGTLAGANPLVQATVVSGNVSLTVTGADIPLQNLADDNMWRGPVTLGVTTSIDVAANSRLS